MKIAIPRRENKGRSRSDELVLLASVAEFC